MLTTGQKPSSGPPTDCLTKAPAAPLPPASTPTSLIHTPAQPLVAATELEVLQTKHENIKKMYNNALTEKNALEKSVKSWKTGYYGMRNA